MPTQKLDHAFDGINADKLQLPRIQNEGYMNDKIGSFVSIRPAGQGQRTYLGIYLGDMHITVGCEVEGSTLVLSPQVANPAIFIPELKQIMYGVESWWGPINSPEELRTITNEDINQVWYVQALKAMYPDVEVPGSETVQ